MNMEKELMLTLKKGESFFTTKDDKHITAIATYYKVKVKTERYMAIDKATNKKIEQITKVIML